MPSISAARCRFVLIFFSCVPLTLLITHWRTLSIQCRQCFDVTIDIAFCFARFLCVWIFSAWKLPNTLACSSMMPQGSVPASYVRKIYFAFSFNHSLLDWSFPKASTNRQAVATCMSTTSMMTTMMMQISPTTTFPTENAPNATVLQSLRVSISCIAGILSVVSHGIVCVFGRSISGNCCK